MDWVLDENQQWRLIDEHIGYHAMTKRTCSIDGCDRRHKAKGLCGMHYARLLARGDVGPVAPHRDHNATCSIVGCSRKHKAFGFCAKHYRQYGSGKLCSVDDCEKASVVRGLCDMHYKRWWKHGDVGPPGRIPTVRQITSRGYAIVHQPEHPNAYESGHVLEHKLLCPQK